MGGERRGCNSDPGKNSPLFLGRWRSVTSPPPAWTARLQFPVKKVRLCWQVRTQGSQQMWVSLFIMLHTGAKGLIYAVIFQNYFSKNTDSTHEVVLNSMLVHVNCISFFCCDFTHLLWTQSGWYTDTGAVNVLQRKLLPTQLLILWWVIGISSCVWGRDKKRARERVREACIPHWSVVQQLFSYQMCHGRQQQKML